MPGRRRSALCLAGLVVAAGAVYAESPSVHWADRIEVAKGDAFRGPWRMNESNFLFVDDPTVVLQDDGAIAVAWGDLARKDILLQIYEPDGTPRLEEPVNVSRSPDTFSWLSRMVTAPGDAERVFILWQEIVFSGGTHGGEIFFARSTDGGRTFDEPVNLSNTMAGAGKGRLTSRRWDNGSLDLVMDRNGRLYASWTDYEGPLWFSVSTDGGRTFSEPKQIAGGDGEQPARGPSLAVHNDVIHLAWAVGEDPAADIQYTVSRDRGTSFEPPRTVHISDGHADAPRIVTCGEGVVHLVYAESARGMFRAYEVYYTQLDKGADAFDAPRTISGAQSDDFYSVHYPEIDVDGEGRLYVLWELAPGRRTRSQGLGFSFSGDGGKSFSEPVVVPGTGDPELGYNGSQQGLLMRKLDVNRDGAVAVVNSTFRRNRSSHIWLIRGQIEMRD